MRTLAGSITYSAPVIQNWADGKDDHFQDVLVDVGHTTPISQEKLQQMLHPEGQEHEQMLQKLEEFGLIRATVDQNSGKFPAGDHTQNFFHSYWQHDFNGNIANPAHTHAAHSYVALFGKPGTSRILSTYFVSRAAYANHLFDLLGEEKEDESAYFERKIRRYAENMGCRDLDNEKELHAEAMLMPGGIVSILRRQRFLNQALLSLPDHSKYIQNWRVRSNLTTGIIFHPTKLAHGAGPSPDWSLRSKTLSDVFNTYLQLRSWVRKTGLHQYFHEKGHKA